MCPTIWPKKVHPRLPCILYESKQQTVSDSCTDFACCVLRFPPYKGAIYLGDSSELNVMEEGSVSFFNNHAGGAAGKYAYGFLPSIAALYLGVRRYRV